jgi:hypothetical protein
MDDADLGEKHNALLNINWGEPRAEDANPLHHTVRGGAKGSAVRASLKAMQTSLNLSRTNCTSREVDLIAALILCGAPRHLGSDQNGDFERPTESVWIQSGCAPSIAVQSSVRHSRLARHADGFHVARNCTILALLCTIADHSIKIVQKRQRARPRRRQTFGLER